jgi:outer membrane usher protein
LSSGTLVGGITLGRDNSLDPYYQQYHVPAFTGSATLSSTAELYVNGMLQRTYELNPGMFRIDGLPVTAGRGDILVRVRDELGQVVDLNRSYYLSTQLLAAGRHDFRLTSGLKRRDLDGRVTYADWAAVGGHRVGVTEWLTLGTFAEGDRDSIAGGGEISLGAPVLGELNLSGAVSRDRAATLGYAASASWSLTMRHLSLSASGQWRGETYHGLEDPPGNRTQPWSARAFIGVPLGGIGSFAIEAAAQDLIEVTLPSSAFELPAIVESRVGRIGMRTDVRVLRGVNLRASAYWTRNVTSKERYWEGTVGLVLSPGARVSMSAEMTRDRQRDLLLTDVNRPLSRDRGLGFRLRGVGPLNAREQRVQGQLDMQNSLARATVTHERDFTGNSSSSAFLEGGIIQVGPAVALSRPVNSSFALVKVPDVRGVTVYRDHDVVGRTGRAGRFLVPDLQAYYGNVLSIEDTDLPLDVLVNQTRQVVAPPFRGGATVVFPTKRLRAYTGTVRLDPWPSTRARYGTIFFRRAETELTSPLGADGSFYLDGAEPGPYDVEIEMGDASCRLTVTVPAGTGMTTPIGEIVCRVNGSGGTP